MKKAVFFIVLVAITLFCIFYGTSKHVGNLKHVFKDDYEEENKVFTEKNLINETFQSFSKIDLNAAIMEVTIEEGSDFKVEGSYNKESLKPEIIVRNGTLVLTQKGTRNGSNPGINKCKVVITLPRQAALDSVQINSNVGDIKLADFIANEIGINLNVGEIEVRNVSFDKIRCANNVGKVSIKSAASIKDYEISASTDVGGVRIDGHSYKRSYNQQGKGSKRIKVDTNVGEINIR